LQHSPAGQYNGGYGSRTNQTHDSARRSPAAAPDPLQEAIDHGIDISMLKDNLAMTVAERLRRHDMALNLVEMLQKAKRV
jgi:hypothetical protein